MTPSKYQSAIYDWAQKKDGSARVMAVAGSGKTSTLVGLSDNIDGKVLFCAFNKHIQTELARQLPKNVSCRTIHSLGLQALRFQLGYAEIDDEKYQKICAPLIEKMAKQYRRRVNKKSNLITGRYRIRRTLENLAVMAMTTMTDPKDYRGLRDMCIKYGMDIPRVQREQFFELVPDVIKRGVQKTELGEIDYIDMIYYPAAKGLKMKRHDWVLVDEAQDLSASQLAVVMGALGPGGRIVAVGDKLQSLYGFSGADPWSFKRVQEATMASDLPLSICYRCSEAVVELARELCPEIECRKDAPAGSVEAINRIDFKSAAEPGDMVVCRTNAPLVGACLDLVKEGRQAYVRGYDLKNTLTRIVEGVMDDPDYDWDSFEDIAAEQCAAVVESCVEEDDAQGAQMILDRYEAIDVCLERADVRSADELKSAITDLFTERRNSTVFSTVHRAKGLEADNVFVLHPHNLRLFWKGQKPWQAYQEQCCEYVAITRARENLFFVEEPEKPYEVGDRLDLPKEN